MGGGRRRSGGRVFATPAGCPSRVGARQPVVDSRRSRRRLTPRTRWLASGAPWHSRSSTTGTGSAARSRGDARPRRKCGTEPESRRSCEAVRGIRAQVARFGLIGQIADVVVTGTRVAVWSTGMRIWSGGNGRGTSRRIAKAGAVLTALVLFFQVTGLCLCSSAAKACEAGGCCPRATSAQYHQGAAASHGFAAPAHACCPAARAPSPAQARLQDRSPDREAAPAVAASQPRAEADALRPAPDLVSLLTVHSSSPPTLILRI